MDVDQLLEELTIEQLTEWQAYYELEPFGMPWNQTALLASILANANRDPKEKPEPYTLNEFLPVPADDAEEDDQSQSPDEEPDWMRWKRNLRAYGKAVAPPQERIQ